MAGAKLARGRRESLGNHSTLLSEVKFAQCGAIYDVVAGRIVSTSALLGRRANGLRMDDQTTDRQGGGMRFRKLPISWSLLWGIACVLLICRRHFGTSFADRQSYKTCVLEASTTHIAILGGRHVTSGSQAAWDK